MSHLYHCEACNTSVTEKYGSGRFCSAKCARSFSTKTSKKETQVERSCVDCGVSVLASKFTSKNVVRCDSCKSNFEDAKSGNSQYVAIKNCTQCGTPFETSIHIDKRLCGHENCKKYQLIPTLIKRFNFDASAVGTSRYHDEIERIRSLLYTDHVVNHLTLQKLVDKYNYTNVSTMSKTLKSLGITTTSASDAMINYTLSDAYKPNNTPNLKYQQGWHTTFTGEKVFYRSSYELDYATQLDEKQTVYEMETLRIQYFDSVKGRMRLAIPDFYIPSKNLIVEIKSPWTLDAQNMFDKCNEYRKLGYEVVVLVDKKEVDSTCLSTLTKLSKR